MIIPPTNSIDSSNVTTYYNISGEICYGEGGFVESYSITGELKVILKPISYNLIECENSYYINNTKSEITIDQGAETHLYENRRNADGNYTLFYIENPTPNLLKTNNFAENIEANYLGEYYTLFNGKYIKTHYFCYSIAEMQNILRYEWFYDTESGVLLRFIKSVETNFVRVQWTDYNIENTTLSFSNSHPITAIFTNFKEIFFAVIGSSISVGITFYYLVQKKAKRSLPN